MLKKIDWKELGIDVLVDIVAGIIIAIGVYNFALNANFPVAGFSGIAIVLYHLFGISVWRYNCYENGPLSSIRTAFCRTL